MYPYRNSLQYLLQYLLYKVKILLIIMIIILINNDLDIKLNKKRRDTNLIARRLEDILSSLSSDRKNSVLKFKGVNIQYVNLHEQFHP